MSRTLFWPHDAACGAASQAVLRRTRVRLREYLPATTLGRTRLAALAFASVSVLAQLTQLDSAFPGWRRALAIGAAALVLADFGATFVRTRAPAIEPLLIGLAIFAVGIGLRDPFTVTGLCMAAATTQSLYGSNLATTIRTAALLVASPATVAVSPISYGRHMAWNSGAVLGVLPVAPMFTVLMRVLLTTLVRQEHANAREALLARTSRQLMGRTVVHDVRAIIQQTITELCAMTPGLVLLVVRRHGDTSGHLLVEVGFGLSDDVRGARLPDACVAHIDVMDTQTVEMISQDTAAIDALVGVRCAWRAAGTGTLDRKRFVLVGGSPEVPEDILHALRTVTAQHSLAETHCHSHTELAHPAFHDRLTRMPNGTAFFRALATTVDAVRDDERVALLVVDLDDFKRVNDTLGHAAGDELLVEIANRMTAVSDAWTRGSAGQCLAARFGGDEFAMLLTDVRDCAEAVDVAHRLCESIRQPVRLKIATAGRRVGLSVYHCSCALNQLGLGLCLQPGGRRDARDDREHDPHRIEPVEPDARALPEPRRAAAGGR